MGGWGVGGGDVGEVFFNGAEACYVSGYMIMDLFCFLCLDSVLKIQIKRYKPLLEFKKFSTLSGIIVYRREY